MSFTTTVDEDELRHARTNFAIILGEFEAAGKALAGVQDQYPAAAEGQIATAIYNAVGNTHTHIRELCDFLNIRIMEPMDQAGIHASQEALERAGEIARMGNDGVTDVGDVTGTWNDGTIDDTSAMGQDQSSIDLDFIDTDK